MLPSAWVNSSKIVFNLSAGIPMPVSVTSRRNRTRFAASAGTLVKRSRTDPCVGVLDGVVQQIDDDLPHPQRVAKQMRRHLRRDFARQLQPPIGCLRRQQPRAATDQFPGIERDLLQSHSTRLYFGQIKNVVYQRQQRVGALPRGLQFLPLGSRQLAVEGDLKHPLDAV